MTYLVDANILSEPTKPRPDEAVIDWLRMNQGEIVVDSVILGEIRLGIIRLPKGRKRDHLQRWFEEGIEKIVCLPWDREIAMRWAELVVKVRKAGRTLPLFDSMIAATALTYGLQIVTRNRHDFENLGVNVINPFE